MVRFATLAAALSLALGLAISSTPAHAERTNQVATIQAFKAEVGRKAFKDFKRGNGFTMVPWAFKEVAATREQIGGRSKVGLVAFQPVSPSDKVYGVKMVPVVGSRTTYANGARRASAAGGNTFVDAKGNISQQPRDPKTGRFLKVDR